MRGCCRSILWRFGGAWIGILSVLGADPVSQRGPTSVGEAQPAPDPARLERSASTSEQANPVKAAQPGSVEPLVLRGWQIESVVAVQSDRFTRLASEDVSAGIRGQIVRPRRGVFVMVQVSCKWVTSDPPSESLWTGKPDAVLVDQNRREYSALCVVQQFGSEFAARGMAPLPARIPSTTLTQIACFDLPTNASELSIRLTSGGDLAPVDRVEHLAGN